MGLRTRLNDLSYRVYDRMRPRAAFEASSAPAAADGFAHLRGRRYALLVTYRRDGTPVPTPVWFGLDSAGRFYCHTEARTAKVRRVRNDPRGARDPVRRARQAPRAAGGRDRPRHRQAIGDADHAEATIQANYGTGRRVYEGTMMSGANAVYIEVAPT